MRVYDKLKRRNIFLSSMELVLDKQVREAFFIRNNNFVLPVCHSANIRALFRRCPFLDPVKSKRTYRVPGGGRPTFPAVPAFYEASDPASMAAQLYSAIASYKSKKQLAETASDRERQRLGNTDGGISKRPKDGAGTASGRAKEENRDDTMVVQFPPSLKASFAERFGEFFRIVVLALKLGRDPSRCRKEKYLRWVGKRKHIETPCSVRERRV